MCGPLHGGIHTLVGRHPPSRILRDTVNKRAVCILLECILVCNMKSYRDIRPLYSTEVRHIEGNILIVDVQDI